MLSFSFNGIRKDYVHMLRGRKRPPWPTLARNILTVPGRPGGYLQGTEIQPRIIEVPIAIRGQNIGDLQKLKEDLASWLVTDEPKELVFDDEPDRTYYAVVDETIDFDEIAYLGQGTIRFLCPDPYKYGPLRTQTINVPPASFSRNSVAYLSDGTQVSANQPRFENGGVLIEEGTTNILPAGSENFQTGWQTYGGATVTVTSGRSDPFGGTGAYRIQTSGGSNISKYLINVKNHSVNGVAYSGSLWIKNNGLAPVDVSLNISSSVTVTSNQWTRIQLPNRVGNGSLILQLAFRAKDAADSLDFDVMYPQVEEKPYITSYISPGTTRRSETLTLPTAGVLFPDEGTIEMEVEVPFIANWNNFFLMPTNNGRFLLFFDSDRKVRFDYGANNQGIISPNDVISPNVKTFIAMRWSKSQNKMALFVNGTKYENALPNGIADSFPDTVSVVNRYSAKLYNLRFSRIARSDAEIMDAYQNGFTVDEYTTAYLPFDGSLEIQTPNIVVNAGTAETYPTFTAFVKQPITFLDIIAPDAYMRVGQPVNTETQMPVQREELILWDQMSTTTGWTSGGTIVDGAVAGSIESTGYAFQPKNYGTGTGWHGPALKKSLSTVLENFTVEALVELYNSDPDMVGRVEVYLLDDTGSVIGKMAMKDVELGSSTAYAESRIGNAAVYYHLIDEHGRYRWTWNDFYGVLRMGRHNGQWFAYVAKIDKSTGKHHSRMYRTYIDADQQFTKNLAQIEVHFGQMGVYKPANVRIQDIKVYKWNPITQSEIPYIAYPDDVLQFDHKNAVVYRNGEPIMSQKDFGARFFPLAPGATELAVNPSDAAIVEIEFRPRYK